MASSPFPAPPSTGERESRVEPSREELGSLFRSLPDPILLVDDRTLEIVACNAALARSLGFAERELEGQGIQVLISGPESSRLGALAKPWPSGFQSNDRGVFNFARRDGTLVGFELAQDIIRFMDRNCLMFHGRATSGPTSTNPSPTPLEELSQRSARDRASDLRRRNELEHAKTQFFNSAAHELGTPLTPIKLQLHLLRTGDQDTLTPQQQKSLEILDRNVDRLSRLAQELLDVARLQAGHLNLQVRWTDVNEVIREVVESFEPVAAARRVTLAWHNDTPLPMEVDAKRIAQVVFSLLNNAFKFTPEGGRVEIERAESDREIMIMVRDTGAGIAPEQMSRLFEPFSDAHENARAFGTGLGLFVSRGIIELHGGRIWCESQGPGQGTTFGFSLPRIATVAREPDAFAAPASLSGVKPPMVAEPS